MLALAISQFSANCCADTAADNARCFSRMLPAILKPLLKRRGLERATGAEGHLRKQGAFADRLVVCYQ